MVATPKFNHRKLVGSELVSFVEQNDARTLSVIIELPVDQTNIKFARGEHDGEDHRPVELPPVDEDEERKRMNRLEQELKKLVENKFVRLDVAQAFVVDLTPAQLRAVSLLDDVGCVRPNQTRRVEK